MQRILVTGTNRGLGFELVRQLLVAGHRVFAACRNPDGARSLAKLSRRYAASLEVLELDVSDDESVMRAHAVVSARATAIDLLINNAGMLDADESLETFDAGIMLRSFDVNAVGPMRVARAFLDLLKQGEGARIVNVSSQLGSLQLMDSGWGRYSYNASKAALNMITGKLAHDLADVGICVVALHPGWVRTAMGGSGAPLAVKDSAASIIRVVSGLAPADSGRFLTYTGEEHPW